MRAEATYETDHIELTFEGEIEEYEEGNEVTNIKCIEVKLFDCAVDLDSLPDALQAAILDIGNTGVEFDPSDSSDFDDIDD